MSSSLLLPVRIQFDSMGGREILVYHSFATMSIPTTVHVVVCSNNVFVFLQVATPAVN